MDEKTILDIKVSNLKDKQVEVTREIILDTETTGLKVEQGDRIIEIGAIEVINKVKTGKFFHVFINPERDVSAGAFNIHNISTKFLLDKPKFSEVVEAFLAFIGNDKLVIHNARFDVKFINGELSRLRRGPIEYERAIDTLAIARRKFPGSPANLDALCKRFNISTKTREEKGHGALLDSELLYKVYICLTEGIQSELIFKKAEALAFDAAGKSKKETIKPREFAYKEDFKEHKAFIKNIENNLWEKENT